MACRGVAGGNGSFYVFSYVRVRTYVRTYVHIMYVRG